MWLLWAKMKTPSNARHMASLPVTPSVRYLDGRCLQTKRQQKYKRRTSAWNVSEGVVGCSTNGMLTGEPLGRPVSRESSAATVTIVT